MTAAEKLLWGLAFLRRAHVRLTVSREKILRFLCAHRLPVSIEMITRSEDFACDCAETTIYRTLILFRELDLARQINLPGKTSYFLLNVPSERSDFLVCRHCGRVQELTPPKEILRLEEVVAAKSGFVSVFHELEIFGICPACQTACHTEPTTKLGCLKRTMTRPTDFGG
jgi:Fe2+ or Zn2+ uptake regulation protein